MSSRHGHALICWSGCWPKGSVGNHVVVGSTMHVVVACIVPKLALHMFLMWPHNQPVDSTIEIDVLSATTIGCNMVIEIHTSLHQSAMYSNTSC
jgi:hypothetical protein